MTVTVLNRRSLNRATLERQLLLRLLRFAVADADTHDVQLVLRES